MIFIGRLDNLPMPPSVNQCYAQVGKRRISSTALKKYKHGVVMWAVLNRPHLIDVRDELEPALDGKKLFLRFLFRFPSKKLKFKKGSAPKKIDTSNRIKPAEDSVSELLGFDDRWVFKLEAEKVEGKSDHETFDCLIYVYE